MDIWTAPRAGGTQSRLTTFEGVPGYGGIDLEIVGDKAVWTRWGKGGVFEMPLSGGTPRLLPGTSAYTLIGWPWAATPPYDHKKWKKKRVIFGDLLNIKTGKRSKASVEPPAFCGISWCVKSGALVSRKGSTRDLPGMPRPGRFPLAGPRPLPPADAADRGRQTSRSGAVRRDHAPGRRSRAAAGQERGAVGNARGGAGPPGARAVPVRPGRQAGDRESEGHPMIVRNPR